MENTGKATLEQLLNYFNDKNFDLDVWKIKASLIFKKLFGEENEKIDLVKQLHYDYSSWSLRDKTGSKQPDSIKEQARGLTEVALFEYSFNENESVFFSILKGTLSEDEFSKLDKKMKNSGASEQVLSKYFSKIAGASKDKILAQLILNYSK